MRRRWLVILILFALAAAGCGRKPAGEAPPAKPPGAQQQAQPPAPQVTAALPAQPSEVAATPASPEASPTQQAAQPTGQGQPEVQPTAPTQPATPAQPTAPQPTAAQPRAAEPAAPAQVQVGAPQPAALPGGKLEVVLAKRRVLPGPGGYGTREEFEPVPSAEFPEDTREICMMLRLGSTGPQEVKIDVKLIAVNADMLRPNQLADFSYGRGDTLNLRKTLSGEKWTAMGGDDCLKGSMFVGPKWVVPGQMGVGQARFDTFPPGDYRVDLTMDGRPERSLPFKVVPILTPVPLLEEADPPRGFNIALAALGGKALEPPNQAPYLVGRRARLIDGIAVYPEWDLGGSCRPESPQEVVLAFHQDREAQIAAVVIDTTTMATLDGALRSPKHVEVWVSTTSPTEGFTRIAAVRLQRRAAEHLIRFPPTKAKYVKLRFLSAHITGACSVGEVKIIEAADAGPSIVADLSKNLALPALGGSIVRFSSQTGRASYLVDGSTDTHGWQSEEFKRGALPQEIVFAFNGSQAALIDRIVLNPKTKADPSTWVKDFTVFVSTESPISGFEEVGRFTLAKEPRDQAFPIGKKARFVMLRILSNHGSRKSPTSLGEVQLIEGTAPGYQSVLLETRQVTAVVRAPGGGPPVDEAGIAVEKEPNNSPAEANPLELGRRTKGSIDPLGEQDHFKFSVAGTSPSVLTLELLGRPAIRTSLGLLDASGTTLRQFDPQRAAGDRALFSWAVKPGDHVIWMTEPPASIVVIWDTSGSMVGNIEDLRRAVEKFLDQVRPTERLNLIRFSSDVEVLLKEFTSDRDRLKAAAQGKFVADGATALYDAVAAGIELLKNAGNRAIVVMTDGADTRSRVHYPDFWRMLERERIPIYTVAFGPVRGYSEWYASTGDRSLAHISMATGGRFFFAPTGEDLVKAFQQVADELRKASTYYLRAALSAGPGSLTVTAAGEQVVAVPPQIELILDASGSMKRKIEGRMMIDIAKDVMVQIIKSLPDSIRVALRVYGHRVREGRPGDCQDSELVFPFGKIDKERMIARVRGIKALGTTPIAYSLQQVARDFGNAPGEKMVILVTDGKEECKGSPSAVVADLVAKGVKVRLNIVGFALAEEATRKEMDRIAKLTGGKFFDARDARGLGQAIQQALAVPFDVLDAAGERVGGGLTGQQVRLPEGIYTVVVRGAGAPVAIPNVRIALERQTKVTLKKEGQEVRFKVTGP